MYRTLPIKSNIAMVVFLLLSTLSIAQTTSKPKPKFGKGISYIAKDSSFTTRFNLRMQSLYTATYDQTADSDEWSSQFLVRRFRLKWDGYALTPKLKYKVELGMSNRDISTNNEDGNTRGGARVILDAVLKWKFHKNFEFWVGQTKLPGNRERVISSGSLQFVDRSLVNSRYNIDRDAGIQLRGYFKAGDNMYINPSVAISMGEGRNITANNYGGYNYTAHVDFLPLGKFTNKGDYFAADLEREQELKVSFGFTFDHNDRAVRRGGQLGSFVRDSLGNYAENDLTSFMADMIMKYKGWSLATEYITKSSGEDIEGTSRNFNTGSGLTVSSGYLFKNNVELALRYTTIRKANDFSGLNDENEITLGLSKYIVGHKLKVQTDIAHLAAPGETEGDIRFRAQVEMQF